MTKKGKVKPIESEQLVILRNAVAMAKYDLSRNQQKVFLEIAMMAKNKPDEKFYKLYIREFLKNIGVSTNDTAELKREIEEMRNITIHIPRTKRGGELKANFFASVEIFENQSSRFIEIELSDKLKPYFIEIAEGEFFHYQIENTRVLKSGHSIRMYLYLKAWKWTGKATIRYDELRGILGVKEGDYKLFGDFKRRVLDKCQDELKSKTDIAFDYVLIRERPNNPNTPVNKIAFTIQDNGKIPVIVEVEKYPQTVIPLTIEPDRDIIDLANSIEKTSVEELSTLIGNYGRDRVLDVLLLAKEESERGNKIRSLTAYLHNAIKNNSAAGKSQLRKKKQQDNILLKNHQEIEKTIKRGLDEFKARYFLELGKHAPQDLKTSFFENIQVAIAKNKALKSVYHDGTEWIADNFRIGLGAELNTKSDDELAILYMQSIEKPIQKVNGFWSYA